MALRARDLGVRALERVGRLRLVVVVEVEDLLGRLPVDLGVAAVALEHLLPLEVVRLIVLVARAAHARLAEEQAQALLVLARVAVLALGRGVLAVQLELGPLVVVRAECVLSAERGPAHEVEAAALVVEVAVPALLAGDLHRRMQALARDDLRLLIGVIVAAQALVVGQLFTVGMALRAVVLPFQLRVRLRERTR
jgi:hypothetical protein